MGVQLKLEIRLNFYKVPGKWQKGETEIDSLISVSSQSSKT